MGLTEVVKVVAHAEVLVRVGWNRRAPNTKVYPRSNSWFLVAATSVMVFPIPDLSPTSFWERTSDRRHEVEKSHPLVEGSLETKNPP